MNVCSNDKIGIYLRRKNGDLHAVLHIYIYKKYYIKDYYERNRNKRGK